MFQGDGSHPVVLDNDADKGIQHRFAGPYQVIKVSAPFIRETVLKSHHSAFQDILWDPPLLHDK